MTEERASRLPFAIAGLLTGVGTAWAVLLLTGSLESDWLLAGILALGSGVMVVKVMGRVAPGAFRADAPANPANSPRDDAAAGDDLVPSNPRLRVLITSSCLEALSVALLCAYYLDSLLIAVSSGVAFGLLGIAVSLALARRLAEPA
jgi:hypothetical protein